MNEEIFIVGYPRSGTTHLARLLGDILDSPVRGIQDALPLGQEGLDREGGYVVYQTHMMPSYEPAHALIQDPHNFNADLWTDQKVVHIVRDPRAVALSVSEYWELGSVNNALEAMYQGSHPPSIDYREFMLRWLKTKVYMIKYRDLVEHPLETLAKLFDYFKIPHGSLRIEQAIQRQSFENRRKIVETDGDRLPYGKGIQGKHLFKGKPYEYRLHFTAQDYQKARDYFGDIMDKLDYPQTEEWEIALKKLESIFEIHPNALRACQVLFELARQVESGAIVELGTYHGKTAISLALGSQISHNAPVYSIDDHNKHLDWANNLYVESDIEILQNNLERAGVKVIQYIQDSQKVAETWSRPIALWFWDISVEGQLFTDWVAWREHIQIGGIGFLRDTFDQRLGSKMVLEYEQDLGEFVTELHEPGILLLRRVK